MGLIGREEWGRREKVGKEEREEGGKDGGERWRRRGGRKEEGGRVERKRHRMERGVGDSGVIVQFDTCILLAKLELANQL